MFKVGLTGGIGSGKSVVARVLEVMGVPVFNADEEARALMHQDPVRERIMAAFGKAVYAEGSLQRKELARIVFGDPRKLAALNAIVHPAVRDRFNDWAGEQVAPYVVMEAAILTETSGHQSFDHRVVVSAPEELRLKRVMERDHASEADVRARMRNQAREEDRLAHADTVLLNDGSRLLVPQVVELHEHLLKLAAR